MFITSPPFFRDRQASESTADHLVIFGSGLFFLMAFLAQQEFADTCPLRFFALLLAGIEISLAFFTSLRSKAPPMRVISYTALSIVLTVIATFVTLGKYWVLAALSVEMAVPGWWAFKLDLPVFCWGVYLLGLVVLLGFSCEATLYLAPFESFVPVFNKRFPGCALAIASFYVLLYAGSRQRGILSINERSINAIMFFHNPGLVSNPLVL